MLDVQVLVLLFADACSQIDAPAQQAVLLDQIVVRKQSRGDMQRLHACLQANAWVVEQAKQGLLASTNSWTAGMCACMLAQL